jgi:hypothetical protein
LAVILPESGGGLTLQGSLSCRTETPGSLFLLVGWLAGGDLFVSTKTALRLLTDLLTADGRILPPKYMQQAFYIGTHTYRSSLIQVPRVLGRVVWGVHFSGWG